jgi:hypothetical protein
MGDDARRILFSRLIDDAGLFPPARKAMEAAVADHREARRGPHAWMLGRFLCPVSRLDELAAAGLDDDWIIGAVLDGADWRPDLDRVLAYAGPGTIDALELRCPEEGVGAFAEAAEAVDAAVFVEVAPGDAGAMADALEDVAAHRLGAKLRCGGLTPDAFPADAAVAGFIVTCRQLGLPFKATAGLHHPFRTADASLGVLQHGFVNLLAATALPQDDAWPVVAEADASAFALDADGLGWRDRGAECVDLTAVRALFTAYGSCSFDEPVEDLLTAGILDPEPARA